MKVEFNYNITDRYHVAVFQKSNISTPPIFPTTSRLREISVERNLTLSGRSRLLIRTGQSGCLS